MIPSFWLATILLAGLLGSAGCGRMPVPASMPGLQPAIIGQAPHDPNAFTQGLLIDSNRWLESTGIYGQSQLREVDRETGQVLRHHALPRRWFGEGLAYHRGKLYQLTWQAGVCLVYDRATFAIVNHFRYEGEGWGLTQCDQWLYMSNGSDTIQVRDPETFRIVRTLTVHDQDRTIPRLNELEWVEGEIWANIFQTTTIVRFEPANGRITGYLELNHLPLPEHRHPGQDVLNGIAYDPDTRTVWITGKNWSHLYQLEAPR